MRFKTTSTFNALVALAILGLTVLAATPALAQSGGGTTAASFLRIGMGARSAGLGGAFTAIADDGSANYWNPAGLAGRDNSELMFSHFSWLQDVSVEYAAFAAPVGERGGFGASFTYLSFGKIEGYQNDVQTADIQAYDYTGAVSLGLSLTDQLALGASVKMVGEKLGEVSATAVAFDAGALADLGRVRLGAALVNVGQDLKFIEQGEPLPTALRLGVAGFPLVGSQLLSAADVEIPFDGEMVVRSGLEYSFGGAYFLRGGYSFFPDQDSRSAAGGVAFGAGMRFSGQELNYAFSP
ncbi:MAG TPA: PorV/PorQ family protein, partial [candidate division Zixibacteria bacterium]|nr:PorV/PorQ family protein [candidate division Zixibacteria bacterium]